MKNILKLFVALALSGSLLQADLKTDMDQINTSMLDLNSSLSNVEINTTTLCASLHVLNEQAKDILQDIEQANNSITTPLQLDEETLILEEDLFRTVASLTAQSSLLSNEIAFLQNSADASTFSEAISAMLRLSSDIGEMADRIGVMADNILIMSDNIGLMADRILETQMIQSETMVLTQNTLLQTQTNTLELLSVIETASYDASIENLITEGNLLVARMTLISLNPWNMVSKLEDVREDVDAYAVEVETFKTSLYADIAQNTLYINSDTLQSLVDLSVIMTSLGIVMDGYGIAIQSAQIMTRKTTLLEAMESMLILSSNIGKLSNSILEMADQILLMADNIGVTADQIILTQELQSTNIAAVQISILATQEMAIGIIAANN